MFAIPNRSKMRRAKVGGYRKYLSEGQQYAANAPAELDLWFGYSFLSTALAVIPALPAALVPRTTFYLFRIRRLERRARKKN